MEIIDNFLETETFEMIRGYFFGPQVAWKFNPYKVCAEEKLDSFQFTHTIYHAMRYPIFKEMSMEALDPIFFKLEHEHGGMDTVLRIKANLTPRTIEPEYTDYHKDTSQNNITAIYYLNTNNGFTRFEDGQKVESVSNRMLLFDAQTNHSGVTCTDEKVRGVLNINYFPKNLT